MSDSFPCNPKYRASYATPHDFVFWNGVYVEWESDATSADPRMTIKRILTVPQYEEAITEYRERQALRWYLAKYPDEWPNGA